MESGHTKWIKRILFYNNDENFITCSNDTIKFFNRKQKKCLKTLSGHKKEISDMLLMTNWLLVTASWDKNIKLWQWKNDLQNAQCIKTINNAHPCSVTSLLELPGNILASGCDLLGGYIKL